jgi:hypothetical protein
MKADTKGDGDDSGRCYDEISVGGRDPNVRSRVEPMSDYLRGRSWRCTLVRCTWEEE